MEKISLIAIVGPTAVGKTALSIELAKKFDCEIISIDSVQIYKRFDIGSAKVTPEEMNGVVHHLIDELEPNATCSVYDFQKLARDKIDDIHSRGKMPLLIGGTGFYMNAVLNNYEFTNLEEKTYDIDVEKAKQYVEAFFKAYTSGDKTQMSPFSKEIQPVQGYLLKSMDYVYFIQDDKDETKLVAVVQVTMTDAFELAHQENFVVSLKADKETDSYRVQSIEHGIAEKYRKQIK